jgi:hypothetical protein
VEGMKRGNATIYGERMAKGETTLLPILCYVKKGKMNEEGSVMKGRKSEGRKESEDPHISPSTLEEKG